jgi:hypothetical protein
MVDIHVVAKPLTLSALPSHTAMTALHYTLKSINNTHLSNPCITIPPPPLFDTYSPHSAGIYHLHERTTLTYSPTT